MLNEPMGLDYLRLICAFMMAIWGLTCRLRSCKL
uniref:Uncharacterized protein n=1 Tax=Anguilla anguilla TaxID=7936 RepID=A0A0E9UDI6_ANGAN